MAKKELSAKTLGILLGFQQNEVDEDAIYRGIAKRVKDPKEQDTLLKITAEEKAHSQIWQGHTVRELTPRRGKVLWYTFLSRVFGYTFALKLMENGEDSATGAYEAIAGEVPEAQKISEDENRHEQALLGILDEERLQYVGSMVLGLNDALVELTGTLAGLSFAMQNTRLIALSGLITGISATLSMASSEYLSARSEGDPNAFKSSLYTGVMYLVAVACLVAPYLIFPAEHYLLALATMLLVVVLIIAVFNYYISVAKGYSFKKRFLEMAGISLSVAAISFVIGILVKQFLGIDI